MDREAIIKSWKDAVTKMGAKARFYNQDNHPGYLTSDQCTGHVAIWLRKRAVQKGDRFWQKYMDAPGSTMEEYKPKGDFGRKKVRPIHESAKFGVLEEYIISGSEKSKRKEPPVQLYDPASDPKEVEKDPNVLFKYKFLDISDGAFIETLVSDLKGNLLDIELLGRQPHAVGLDLSNAPNEAVWFDPCFGEISMFSVTFVTWIKENWKLWNFDYSGYNLAIYRPTYAAGLGPT